MLEFCDLVTKELLAQSLRSKRPKKPKSFRTPQALPKRSNHHEEHTEISVSVPSARRSLSTRVQQIKPRDEDFEMDADDMDEGDWSVKNTMFSLLGMSPQPHAQLDRVPSLRVLWSARVSGICGCV